MLPAGAAFFLGDSLPFSSTLLQREMIDFRDSHWEVGCGSAHTNEEAIAEARNRSSWHRALLRPAQDQIAARRSEAGGYDAPSGAAGRGVPARKESSRCGTRRASGTKNQRPNSGPAERPGGREASACPPSN